MPCYHPMLAYRKRGSSDKPIIAHAKVDVKERVYPLSTRNPMAYETLTLPCGQCIGCRLDYSRGWANRMMLELPYHETAYFLTLTYDDDHVPMDMYLSVDDDGFDDDGVVDDGAIHKHLSLTLRPDDLRDFIKRLRDNQAYHHARKISYYAVGEYGSQTARPHYHAIIYGLRLDDLEPFGGANGYTYYRSPTIERLWTYGFSSVCNVSWETCAYCARYMLKKQKGATADVYQRYSLHPEFSRCSLKPAIGKRWYDDHKDEAYDYDEIYLATAKRGVRFKPPHYFDKLFDLEQPEKLQQIKQQRRVVAELAAAAEMEQFNGTYLELLAAKEQTFKDRAAKLIRKL